MPPPDVIIKTLVIDNKNGKWRRRRNYRTVGRVRRRYSIGWSRIPEDTIAK